TIDTTQLDAFRNLGSGAAAPVAKAFGQVDGSIRRLFVSPDVGSLLVETTDDRVVTLDGGTAEMLGSIQLKDAGDLAPGGTAPALVGTAEAVPNPTSAARVLATILGGDQKTYAQRLASTADRTVIARITTSDKRTKI